jgi:hypothetical protein
LKECADVEGRGTEEMQTKDLTDILSAIDMAAGNLCDIDPVWELSRRVKRGIRAILHPYYEIVQENKIKSQQLTLHSLLMSFLSTVWTFFSKIKDYLNYFVSMMYNFLCT